MSPARAVPSGRTRSPPIRRRVRRRFVSSPDRPLPLESLRANKKVGASPRPRLDGSTCPLPAQFRVDVLDPLRFDDAFDDVLYLLQIDLCHWNRFGRIKKWAPAHPLDSPVPHGGAGALPNELKSIGAKRHERKHLVRARERKRINRQDAT